MNCSIYFLLRLIVCWLAAFGSLDRTFADEASASAAIARFVNDDTFAVGYVDLVAIDAAAEGGVWNQLIQFFPQPVEADLPVLQAVSNSIKSLQAAGAESLYVVLGLGDIYQNGGPLVAITLNIDRTPSEVEDTLKGLSQLVSATNASMPKFSVRRHGSRTILVGSEKTMARYESLLATRRDDLIEPLGKMAADGATISAVFSPGNDFRRVVRELWPPLPEPLAAWKGELADQWVRLEFAARSQRLATAELTMQASDIASAELFAKLYLALPSASKQIKELGDKRHDLQRYLQAIVETVPPEVEDTRVVMKLPTDSAKLAKLQRLMNEAKVAALESTRRQQRMQQFKQIALAILNYESAHKHLPPPAICDADGKPLLSWRVAILPYLDQNELYKKFHLDEPWDSPHNLQWSRVLVETYCDPSHLEVAREFKTTYVLPVGVGTALDSKTGATFREITDGTSNTIMLVEVPPEEAVVWTKPEDWEVDLNNPMRGLERTDRDHFTAAWCDGSVSIIPADVKPEVLKAILTRAGSETVDRP